MKRQSTAQIVGVPGACRTFLNTDFCSDCFPMNLEKFNSQDGKLAMLTKGDNNQAGAGTALHIG